MVNWTAFERFFNGEFFVPFQDQIITLYLTISGEIHSMIFSNNVLEVSKNQSTPIVNSLSNFDCSKVPDGLSHRSRTWECVEGSVLSLIPIPDKFNFWLLKFQHYKYTFRRLISWRVTKESWSILDISRLSALTNDISPNRSIKTLQICRLHQFSRTYSLKELISVRWKFAR